MPTSEGGLLSRVFGSLRRMLGGAEPASEPAPEVPPVSPAPAPAPELPPQFERIAGTRAEAESAARGLGVRPWLGEEASRARVLAQRCPRVLHLSAAGFFHAEQPMVIRQESSGEEPVAGGWVNPLFRSGVALSGGKALTAYDLTTMDLKGTEAVVLPDCETPFEQPLSWAKVSGLLSASIHAGAGSVILSLWRADEPVRLEMVQAVYRHLQQGRSPVQALRQARLEVRRRHPEARGWAGWVCIGG
jgi:CHAT domain-containing protein